MSLYKKLIKIQSNLSVPKNQYNQFGKYKYRSCEDIIEAVKPLLEENNLTMTISDELVLIGDRYYIKAKVTVYDSEKGEKIETTGYAREAENKKGMDESQITGAASSYARKYALNGMFAIDDTKDADATNDHDKKKPQTDKSNKTKYISMIRRLYAQNQKKVEPVIVEYLDKFNYDPGNLENVKELDENKSQVLLSAIQKKLEVNK